MKAKENKLVVKSNALARCRINVDSIYEQQLIALTACRIRCDDKDFLEYEIPLTAFKKNDKKTAGSTQALIKKAASSLMTKILEVKDGRDWVLYNVFTKVRFSSAKGSILVQFHPDLKQHYLALVNGKFTQYSLAEYMSLPSVYSQKMYELLRSIDDRTEFSFSIKDLHEMLKTPASLRLNYKDFNNRVLKPALRHITKLTSLRYEYDPIKNGRKFTEIKFVFIRKRMNKLQNKGNKKNVKEQVKLMARSLECWEKRNHICNSENESKMCDICRKTHQVG